MSTGVLTALVTPFKNGKIDWSAFENLIDIQIAAGISGLVISGSTGESPVLSEAEKIDLFACAVNHAAGRAEVIAGTGSYNTAASINLSLQAAKVGVTGVLTVVPYYNKPTQEGLFQHFKAIAQAVAPLPVYLYNVPTRTITDLQPETIIRLAEINNITHVKEASGDVSRVAVIRAGAPALKILSGDDGTFYAGAKAGMDGVISVASNIFPNEMVQLWQAFKKGDVHESDRLNDMLEPLYKFLFCEPNPVPAKAILADWGFLENELRLPLVPLSDSCRQIMQLVLQNIKKNLDGRQ